MNTLKKILLLSLAVILAVGAVLAWAKTRVQPPTAIEAADSFLKDLDSCLSLFKSQSSEGSTDSTFLLLASRIEVFAQEGMVSADMADTKRDELANLYTTLFVQRCRNLFGNSVWKDSDHDYMHVVCNRIRSVKHTDGSMALSSDGERELQEIEQIIKDYRHARAISSKPVYKSVKNARQTISLAEGYQQNATLKNCTSLMSALRAVRRKIAQSHYAYVERHVAMLAEYQTLPNYKEEIRPKAESVLKEYEDQGASLYYGDYRSAKDLRNLAKTYTNAAVDYFLQLYAKPNSSSN